MVVEQVSENFWRLTMNHGSLKLVFWSQDSRKAVVTKARTYIRQLEQQQLIKPTIH